MRDIIPLIPLLTEINCVYPIRNLEPMIKCKVYEDNESYIVMSKTKRFSPRTRHISIKYHHFRHFVDKEIIEILSIRTGDKVADIFTKPLCEELFKYQRMKLCGW